MVNIEKSWFSLEKYMVMKKLRRENGISTSMYEGMKRKTAAGVQILVT